MLESFKEKIDNKIETWTIHLESINDELKTSVSEINLLQQAKSLTSDIPFVLWGPY